MPSKEESEPVVAEARFLDLDDVAEYLNVSVQQVYALVRSGDLPGLKIGGRGVWRVDRTDLEAYVERVKQDTAQWAKSNPLIRGRGGPDK